MPSPLLSLPTLSRGAAAVAVVVAGACTTAMSWRFSYQLGTNAWDGTVWAVFSVALDVAKWLMLPFAALAWRQHKPRAAAAILIWLVATTYSFAAAVGFAALNRDATAAERQHQTELQRTLATMRASPRWQSSAACADATAKLSKDFCAAYREAEAKLKDAIVEANPQTALLAQLTGLPRATIDLTLALFLAVACEVISALGLFAILPPAGGTPTIARAAAPWKRPVWPAMTGRGGINQDKTGQRQPTPQQLTVQKRKAPGS